jgi:hypothetical protein
MPRQTTGRPVGRQPKYLSKDEQPVTVSLRIPRELTEQAKRYASMHRVEKGMTELLLDGLRWRISDGDPRGLGIDHPPQTAQSDNTYYGNTDMPTPALEEIRTALARQETQLQALVQALEHRPVVAVPRSHDDTITHAPGGQPSAPAPTDETHREHGSSETFPGNSNTVLHKRATGDTPTPQPDLPDQAAVLEHLSQMRASGLSFQQMADQLQAEGVPTLSGKGAWNKGTVAKLLAKHQGPPAASRATPLPARRTTRKPKRA